MRNANHEPDGNHVHLQRNIVYAAGTEMFGGNNWHAASKFTSDKNCFFSETGTPDFFGKRFDRWQATGRDKNSIVANPRFVDPARRDFRLQPDSPALGLGFEPIDMSTVGLQGSPSWRDLPKRFQRRTFEAAEPEKRWPLREGFEEYDAGEIPAGAVPDEGGTRVRVVSDHASHGRQSMRFDDAPGATAWKPHWCVYFEPRDGALRLVCSVRNDPEHPASFNLEFRDWPAGGTYRTGPYVQFLSDGTVRAPGGDGVWREIGKLPPGEWARVEIDLFQGDRKRYNLRLTMRDGEPVTIENLPFRSADFQRCNWVGFAGTDTKRATFYVDELTIE
jgi:hypothetical protein